MKIATSSLGRQLRSDFAWVLSGNVLYSACQWGIVLVLAKLGTTAQVGEYALAIALSAPIVFANFQLRALVASDVRNDFSFGQYMTFRLVTLAAGMIAVGCVALFQSNLLLAEIVILVGFAQALEVASDTYYGLMQKHERIDRISRSLMMKGPLSLGAMAVAMYLTHSVAWAVVGLAVGRLIVLLAYDSRLGFTQARGPRPALLEWNPGHMLRLLRTVFPLGVIFLLIALNANVPRYFLQAHAGTSELGIFSAIASLLSAGTLVVSAFGQSIFLPVAQACAEFNRSRYRVLVLQSVAIGGLLGGIGTLAASLFGRAILTKLFRPEYGAHADLFVWLMAAGTLGFIASGAGYVMTATRTLKPQIPIFVGSVVAATAASAWFIPRYGVQGAAYVVLVTALVQLAGTAVVLLSIDRRLAPAREERLFREDALESPQEFLKVELERLPSLPAAGDRI